MAKIQYTVHSVTTDEVAVEAVVGGQVTMAKVERLVVEAISDDGSMGHTFRLSDAKAEDYPVDSTFTATLKPD